MSRHTASAPTAPAAPPASALDTALLVGLVTLTCVRLLLAEVFVRPDLSLLTQALEGVAGPTPATTAWLDGATLLLAVAAFARRGLGGGGWRIYWAATGLLAAAVGVSTCAAGEPRPALLAGLNLLIAVLAGGALARLLTAEWMPRLLLAAVIAGGLANAVKCAMQHYVETPATQQEWQQRRAELLSRGYAPDDPLLVNLERRMAAAEATGYIAHPNVVGECLAMWALVAAGVLLGQRAAATRLLERRVAAAGLVLALLGGLALTGSRGAVASLVAGGTVLGGLVVLGRGKNPPPTPSQGGRGPDAPSPARSLGGRGQTREGIRDWRRVFGVLVVAYVALIAGGAAYGIARGTLPHASLAFRWLYWSAAAKVQADAPLTGVGRENFADAYLVHRVAEGTEEVRNPHNLWVTALVELGPLGLAALVLLGGIAGAAALRRWGHATSLPAAPPMPRGPAGAVIALAPLVAIHMSRTLELAGTGEERMALVVLWAAELLLPWAAALALTAWLLRTAEPRAVAAGIAAALFAGLVHGLVGLTFTTPAGMALAAALVAVVAAPTGADAATAPRRRLAVGVVGSVAVVAYALGVAVPVTRANAASDAFQQITANMAEPRDLDRALVAGRRAVAADPLDRAPPRALARLLLSFARHDALPREQRGRLLDEGEALARRAAGANPRSNAAWRLVARSAELRAALSEGAEAADAARRRAVDAWNRAVLLHPTDPRLRLDAAAAAVDLWRATGDPVAARIARNHLDMAERIDAARKPEEVARLRPTELARLAALRQELEGAAPEPR